MAMARLPRYNKRLEYGFIDVFEQLILIMIIRREVVNFAIRNDIHSLLDTKNDGIRRSWRQPRPRYHSP